jgi:hypothetical protein
MSTSTSNQGCDTSTSNFISIFQTAHEEYKKLTGQDLDAHPFAAELDQCNSPEAISNLLQKQAQAFIQAHKGNEKLLAWLDPTVHVLFTFSATLGEGVGLVSVSSFPYPCFSISISQPFSPAKTIFTGIAVLLEVRLFHNLLMCTCVTINSDGEGYRRELRYAYQCLRAHPSFPSTPPLLHRYPTHTGDDRVTR